MKYLSSLLFSLVILAEFFLGSFLFLPLSLAQSDDRPVIGVSTALTGPAASFGTDIKNAVLFANEDIANGRYRIVVEDDRCNARDAVTIAHRFVTIPNLKAVIGNCSATVIAAATIYQRANIPLFAPLASSPQLSKLGAGVFRTAPSDALSAGQLFSYVQPRQKILAILTEQSDYAVDFAAHFLALAEKSSLETLQESFVGDETNFAPTLLKFRQYGADAVFINANSEESFVRIVRQAKQLRIDLPLYGAMIPGSATFLKLAGSAAENIVFVDFPNNESSLTAEGQRAFQRFVAAHGQPQSWDISFATSYEAVRVIHEFSQSSERPDEFVSGREFQGLFGPYHFDEHGDIQGLQPALRRISQGSSQLLGESFTR